MPQRKIATGLLIMGLSLINMPITAQEYVNCLEIPNTSPYEVMKCQQEQAQRLWNTINAQQQEIEKLQTENNAQQTKLKSMAFQPVQVEVDETWTRVLQLTKGSVCDASYSGLYTIQCGLTGATCLIAASGCNSGQDHGGSNPNQLLCAYSDHALYQAKQMEVQVRGAWNKHKYLYIKPDYRDSYENDKVRTCTITRKH